MEQWLFLVILGILMFVGFLAAFSAASGQRLDLGRRLSMRKGEESTETFDLAKSMERVFKPLGEIVPRSKEEMGKTTRKLVNAGIRRRDGTVLFHGAQVTVAGALFVFFLVSGYIQQNVLLYPLLAILGGMMIPDLWLTWKAQSRQTRIRKGLPDALDLLVVCVEAGLGLDQSLQRIGLEIKETYPDLSDELNRYNLEVNAGQSRAQALRSLGDRVDFDDMRSLVAVLIQTERFGTSIAQTLRVFSDSMRTKRRQRAEEMAAKMSVKMVPPLVFFIFPAIFIVILGPAVISIIRNLLPTLGGR